MAHKRNLLKFSLYSTAVVLPKRLLVGLGWEAGDEVQITTDNKNKRLIISQTSSVAKPINELTPQQPNPIINPKTFSYHTEPNILEETILPIPEID